MNALPNRSLARKLLFIVPALLALLSTALAFAQPPLPTASNTIYLPLVAQAGKPANAPPTNPTPPPTNPTPTPPLPPARSGFFAFDNWLTYNAATAIDGAGGMHLAFYASDEGHQNEPRNQAAYYGYCGAGTAACADSSKWSLVQMDSQVNQVQVVATKDGRPRLLLRRNGKRGYEYDYWACEQDCTNAQNWNGLFVTEAAGVEVRDTYMPQRSFALDSQERPRFVWSNGYGNGRLHGVYYAFCDASDCTQLDTWQHGLMEREQGKTTTADYATLVFDGDKPRVLTRIELSGLPVGVRYYTCDQPDCTSPSSWGWQTIPYPNDKQWASWDLALDKNGNPRIALYEPANIDVNLGGKLYYGACDANCAFDTPFNIVPIASGEGANVDLAIDPQGRTHMIYDAGERGILGETWCDVSCTSADAWQRRILETSDQLTQQLAPASPLTCDQQQRVWFDAIPQAAFDAQGKLVVAYDAVNYARCYSVDPADPTHPVYSQVKRIWWAVRLSQFGQP